MIIEAGSASSAAIAFLASGLSPVRLVHPTGESYVNQEQGTFLDGYCSGGPRCDECRRKSGEEALTAEAARLAEDRIRAEQVGPKLEAATDPAEIAELLLAGGPDLSTSLCKEGWRRFAGSGALPHNHELVRVRLHETFLRSRWGMIDRKPAWKDTPDGQAGTVLDGDGELWWVDAQSASIRGSEAQLFLVAGAYPSFKRFHNGWWRVSGAQSVRPEIESSVVYMIRSTVKASGIVPRDPTN